MAAAAIGLQPEMLGLGEKGPVEEALAPVEDVTDALLGLLLPGVLTEMHKT